MGGSFSIGGGKSKSSSSSQQNSYGYQGSQSAQMSQGSSQSQAGGQSTSTQAIAFQDLFAQLYGGASNAASGAVAQAPELADAARMLFSGGTDFLNQLGGGAGEDYMASRLNSDNPALNDQISALGTDIGDFLKNNVNPTITSNAVSAGTLGGGRQGVAQGAAAAAATKEFAAQAATLRGNDVAARDQVASQLAAARTSAATGALSALPGMYGVAANGLNAGLAPYQALAGILGGPTVLTQGQSSQFSTASSEDIARAISAAFGEDFSNATSKGNSSAWNFNTAGSFSMMGGG